MNSLFLSAALAAATLSGAAAAEAPQTQVAVVSTTGLDLASEAGIHALDLRLLHAASALCGTPSRADARGHIKFNRCREEARANAVAARDHAIQLARGRAAVVASSR